MKERDPLLPSRESEYQSECRNETSVNMKDCNSLSTGMPKRSLYISKLGIAEDKHLKYSQEFSSEDRVGLNLKVGTYVCSICNLG